MLQEIGRADALKKSILPLVLTEGISLPGFISNLKYHPVFDNPEEAITEAREFILNSYNKKVDSLAEVKKQNKKNTLAVVGIGAFLLWAINS